MNPFGSASRKGRSYSLGAKKMDQENFLKMEAAIGVMQRYIEQGYSLSCGYSGGKDSTCTLVLMLEATRRADRTTISHYIQSADTTIENPTIANFLHSVLDELQLYIEESSLPVEIHVRKPSLANQFVVSTIGQGTPVRTPENGERDGKRTRACANHDDCQVSTGRVVLGAKPVARSLTDAYLHIRPSIREVLFLELHTVKAACGVLGA